MSNQDKCRKWQEGFRGRLIRPEDSGYEEARTIYNAMIDRRPAVIARCADIADVLTAVRIGREEGLETAVRGGGHNGPGLSLVDGGLVIDLSDMNGIRVDPEAETVRVGPGCRWGDVDHATHAFGRATVSGIIANTGVGGLTLGGGHGHLSRKYGLTIDNLVGADVVLSDGRLVRADENNNPDLFWALRGGGGNFGIITSFKFRLHPVQTVFGGPLFWPIEALPEALRWYREWQPQAPVEQSAYFLVAEIPSSAPFPESVWGRKVCGLMWCILGPEGQAEGAVGAARRVAAPLFEHVGPMPYPGLQSLLDRFYPAGLQWYWKGDFVQEIPDEAVVAHEKFGRVPTSHSTMHLYPISGAVHEVAPEATAWPHRDANWSMVIAGVDPDPANAGRIRDWARDYWQMLHGYSTGAAYVNFMMEEGEGRIRATYGDNYYRLQQVKAAYDPDNFFHINQNIRPAA